MNTIEFEFNGDMYTCRGAFDCEVGELTDVSLNGEWVGEIIGTIPPDDYDEECVDVFIELIKEWLINH